MDVDDIPCDECPWPGKCGADSVCWLEVEWNDPELPDEPPDAPEDVEE